jgi:glycosyltransferase involved in cell wall biosynthesis
MKVLYDISVLGAGHHNKRARTGIFRVVQNVACSLVTSEKCSLTFCSTGAFRQLQASLDYLNTDAQLQDVPFVMTGTSQFSEILKKEVTVLNHRINADCASLEKLYLRPVRKTVFLAQKIIDQYTEKAPIQRQLRQSDIFHTPFYPIPDEIKRMRKVKKFITVYDLIPLLFPQFFEFNEDHLLKEVVRGITADTYTLAISHATKNDLCNYSSTVDPDKVFVTHLAASDLFYPCQDTDQINAVKLKYGIPTATPYVLSLSTLEPRKNIDQTIRCFARLVQQEQIQDLNLVLVGTKGWDYSKIFEEIAKYGNLHDRIIITGFVDDVDLAALYSGAQMFVYPSFYEGFGLPPLEAMQCGVPVITSNTSSLPEVVGDAGFMVAPTDQDALCQHMLELYRNTDLRQTMAQKSIAQASRFSWETCAKQTIAAYKTALN